MRSFLRAFRPRGVAGWLALAMASAWTLFALSNVAAGQTPLGILRATGHDESLPVIRVISTTSAGEPEQVLVHFPAERADDNGDVVLDNAAGSVHDGVVDVRFADQYLMARVDYEKATDARSILTGLAPVLLVFLVLGGLHLRETRRPVTASTWSSYATSRTTPTGPTSPGLTAAGADGPRQKGAGPDEPPSERPGPRR